jgi:hypothetical protein
VQHHQQQQQQQQQPETEQHLKHPQNKKPF